MNNTSQIRVAVLRGGPSHEYDVSLNTGTSVLAHLPPAYHGIDVFIDEEGVWHLSGVPKSPEKILSQVDVVFNALHGHFGEDGKVQHILELHGIPHTSSPVMSSVYAMNKAFAKNIFSRFGIRTPLHRIIRKEEVNPSLVRDLFTTFPHPSIVKPVASGSSVGVQKISTLSELADALNQVFAYDDRALLEEYIAGREATCAVIPYFRDEQLYTLPVLEVKRPDGYAHTTYDHKLQGDISFDHDSLTALEKAEAKRIAQLAHKALGATHYSRSDMIVHPKRGVFLLETNTQPSLASHAPFVKGLEVVGSNLSQFLDHVLSRALKK